MELTNLSKRGGLIATPKPIYCTEPVLNALSVGADDKELSLRVVKMAFQFLYDGNGIVDEENNVFYTVIEGKYVNLQYQEQADKYIVSEPPEGWQ